MDRQGTVGKLVSSNLTQSPVVVLDGTKCQRQTQQLAVNFV